MNIEHETKKFSGEWLLLFDDQIVDHSANIEDILKTAEERFPEEEYPEDKIKISKVLTEEFHLR
jgi:hypothetical protein